jgi:hypothetical protein
MLIRRFEFKEDPVYGGEGWIPSWMKGANTVTGSGAAHDILEHHPHMALGAEAEFHALGAVYWLRGETGWFYKNTFINLRPENIISRDFPSILERVGEGTESLGQPPKTRALSRNHYGDAEDAIQEIIRNGMRFARKEWEDQRDEDYPMPIPSDSDQRILSWMRMGYRYASKRFGMGNNFETEYLFDRITKEVDKHRDADPGMELTVRINFKKKSVTAYADFPAEDFYY